MKNLSNTDVYELSHPPPNWSQIDPYSDSDINIINDEPKPDNKNVSSDDTIIIEEPTHQDIVELNKPHVTFNACSTKGSSVSSYNLRKRNNKNLNTLSFRTSNRTKQAPVNYAEGTDNNDSDYEPKAKCHKLTNPGLREPSRSRLESQKYINRKRHQTVSAGENTSAYIPYELAYNEERDKKCPHCQSMFYHDKSLLIHIRHVHSNLATTTDDAVDINIPGLNIGTTQNQQIVQETDVSAVNDAKNQSTMTGINNSKTSPVMGINGEPALEDVIGKNFGNYQDAQGINILENTESSVPTQVENESNPQDVTGRNNEEDQAVKGINDEKITEPSVTAPAQESLHQKDEKVSPIQPSTSRHKPSTTVHLAENISQQKFGHHKRRLKPKGKHCRLPIPLDKQDKKNSQTKTEPRKARSEFVTLTHGVRKIKKIRCFKCQVCKDVSTSQAEANKHYKLNHPPLPCPQCHLTFVNPCSLRRHKYSHVSLKFFCRFCGKGYAFESDLNNHKLKHRRHPGYQCNQVSSGRICGKWYFAKGDLTKHLKTHSGVVHQCYECDYMTFDVWYLQAHRYTHLECEEYHCSKCERRFKHHMQLKRHLEKC